MNVMPNGVRCWRLARCVLLEGMKYGEKHARARKEKTSREAHAGAEA